MEKLYYMTRESIVETFRKWDAAAKAGNWNNPFDAEKSADAFIEFAEFQMAGNADHGSQD